jgi:hypothetical protein
MKTAWNPLSAVLAGVLFVAATPTLAQDATPTQNIFLQKTIGQPTVTAPVPSLFVVNSEGATLADGKLVLTGVDRNVIAFADRPVRSAGHLMTEQAIQQWDEGKDNFIKDPPNATISVLAGDGSDVEDAVVTLTHPVLDGTSLTFDVTVLEGGITKSGPAALFIDMGRFGGFHGGGVHAGSFNDVHVNDVHTGSYYHAPDYHGGWYRAPDAVAAGAVAGAAVGAAVTHPYAYGGGYPDYPPAGYAYPPYCGYAPYPPCY